ncbi:catabolite control protein A [Pseudoflavonifractor sp. 60]|uniref:catabolite control protein A n=1 Tax=Pseudoflavonifractor sp. 60 TaxID=2304576 RepID=UPI001371C042|nr:catabolite control protein A [Pseudoflavonifractor sp. 60]
MKKRFAILLAAVMLLSACGGPTSPGTSSSESSASSGQTSVSASTQVPGGNAVQFEPSATVEETVLVDESDVKITATGLKYTAYDVKLSLAIENNSDKNLSFYSGTLGYNCNSVNGYMVDDGYLNADIAAGKKSNETVSFSVDELTLLGISDIADIELGFNITDDQYNDYLLTGPRQLKTSIADSYNYEEDTYRQAIADNVPALGFALDYDSENEVYDQKGIHVISQTLVTNSSGEQALLVEIENTSSDTVYVSVGDITINGLGVQSGNWSTDWISAGKHRVVTINLSSVLDKSYQTAFGLENIGQITYFLEPKDSVLDTLVVPQTLTFAVPGRNTSFDASGEELYREDGIHIVSKGLVPDSFELSDDIHLLLLVENSASEQLSFDIDFNSVSVNGYMTNFICFSRTVAPGGSGVLDVELMGLSLEENGITEPESITEVELTVEAKNDSYKTIAKPVVTAKGN